MVSVKQMIFSFETDSTPASSASKNVFGASMTKPEIDLAENSTENSKNVEQTEQSPSMELNSPKQFMERTFVSARSANESSTQKSRMEHSRDDSKPKNSTPVNPHIADFSKEYTERLAGIKLKRFDANGPPRSPPPRAPLPQLGKTDPMPRKSKFDKDLKKLWEEREARLEDLHQALAKSVKEDEEKKEKRNGTATDEHSAVIGRQEHHSLESSGGQNNKDYAPKVAKILLDDIPNSQALYKSPPQSTSLLQRTSDSKSNDSAPTKKDESGMNAQETRSSHNRLPARTSAILDQDVAPSTTKLEATVHSTAQNEAYIKSSRHKRVARTSSFEKFNSKLFTGQPAVQSATRPPSGGLRVGTNSEASSPSLATNTTPSTRNGTFSSSTTAPTIVSNYMPTISTNVPKSFGHKPNRSREFMNASTQTWSLHRRREPLFWNFSKDDFLLMSRQNASVAVDIGRKPSEKSHFDGFRTLSWSLASDVINKRKSQHPYKELASPTQEFVPLSQPILEEEPCADINNQYIFNWQDEVIPPKTLCFRLKQWRQKFILFWLGLRKGTRSAIVDLDMLEGTPVPLLSPPVLLLDPEVQSFQGSKGRPLSFLKFSGHWRFSSSRPLSQLVLSIPPDSYDRYVELQRERGQSISPRGYLQYLESYFDTEWEHYLRRFSMYVEQKFE